jgi:hypothetical protein
MDLVDPTAVCNDTNVGLTSAVNYTFTAVDAGRRTFNFNYPNAAANVKVRMRDTSVTPSQPTCSFDNFTIRPASFTSVVSGAPLDMNNAATSGAPSAMAGSGTFTLIAATGIVGYTGTPKIDNAAVQAHAGATQNGAVGGAFPAALTATGTSTGTSAFTYSEVGNFFFLGSAATLGSITARGVYDDTFTAVDSTADCTADFSNVLSSGKYGCKFGVTANSSYFGRFIPDHFDTTVSGGLTCTAGLSALTPTCPATGFIYADQPFAMAVKAMNAADVLTQNYAGTFAKAVTLSAVDAASAAITVGGILNGNVASAAFVAGRATLLATAPSPTSFHFTTTPTTPTNMYVKAVDGEVSSSVVTPANHPLEGGFKVVSGRIKLSNAHGSELLPLPMTAAVQYFNAVGGWVSSDSDTVTTIVASDFALAFPVATANNLVSCETALSVTGSSPSFRVNLSRPGNGNNGWTDLTLNLGAAAVGNRCTAVGGAGAASTTAARPWLQFPVGTNPTSRATFGVYQGRKEFIYMRENY